MGSGAASPDLARHGAEREPARRLIDSVTVEGDRVTVEAAPEFADTWLTEPFYARYSEDVDLGRCDETLLTVPFLLNVAPVAWLSGQTWQVDRMDRRLARSLDELREVMARLHPQESWSGKIVASELVDLTLTDSPGGEDAAVLFSGGVDSVYSSLGVGGLQRLVTVRGADVPLDDHDLWDAAWSQTRAYAEQTGHSASWVESNFMRCLDGAALSQRCPLGGEWWARVQHGMALLGLTAPVVGAAGIARVVIAESHGPGGAVSWGSHPDLDPKVAWAGVRVESHGQEAERQDKIAAIAANPRPVPLRVCWERLDGDHGSNCCACEKCLSTALGLMVEGVDPSGFGFDQSADELDRAARSALLRHELAIKSEIHKRRWRMLKGRARDRRKQADHPYPATLRWLSWAPLIAYRRRQALKVRLSKLRSRETPAKARRRVSLLGMELDAVDEAQLVGSVGTSLADGRGGWIITPNLDHLYRFRRSGEIRAAFTEAEYVVADGMPLVWASRLQGTPLPGRVAGSDLIYSLAAEAGRRDGSLFLVGGNPGTADAAADTLAARSPGLQIAGTACPAFGFIDNPAALAEVVDEIRAAQPDLVFVGLPLDGQLALVPELRRALPSAWVAGLGVSFSFVTGDVARAPRAMQRTGTEWLWRLAQEPRRLARRYLTQGLPLAVVLMARAVAVRALAHRSR